MADRRDRRRSSASQQTIDASYDNHHESFDMFSSDYAVDSLPVADGYQPSSLSRDANPSSSPPRATSRRSIAFQTDPSMLSDSQKKKKQSLHDSAAGLAPRNSFSLRHDAQYSEAPRRMTTVSSASGMSGISSLRPFSTASRLSMPRPPSHYAGASAPSHPYGMYPQNISLNRQSVASTIRSSPHRSNSSSQRPTHPYGMYPQSTEDSETDPMLSSTDIASVGFPGLNQQFARRVESGAEEADDIIGPDGHTEQLPPYSRYPDGREAGPLAPKLRTASSLPPGSRISHLSTMMEMPQSAHSATSMTDALLTNRNTVGGLSSLYATSVPPHEYSTREKLAQKSRQRTCFGRLPVWAVVLMLILLVMVAATLGGVVGKVLHQSHQDDTTPTAGAQTTPTPVTVYTSTVYDAAPLMTTATDIPPAPTGDYSLVVGSPSQQSDTCLDSSDGFAWQCTTGALLNLGVSNPPWTAAQISVSPNNQLDRHGFSYGAMPPNFSGTASASLMNDTNDPEFGPALFFYQPFDKIVVLPIDANLHSPPPSKRSLWSSSERSSSEKVKRGSNGSALKAGDQAWLCYWNNTMLEGFIYVEKNTTADSNNTSVAESIVSSEAAQPTPSPGEKRDEHRQRYHLWDGFNTANAKAQLPANIPQLYPRIVKLQERRDPQTRKQPYCTVMQLQADNTFAPVPGNTTTIDLPETDATASNERIVFVPVRPRSTEATSEPTMDKRQSAANFCHCEWLSH